MPPKSIATASKTFGTEMEDLQRFIDHHQTAFALRLVQHVGSRAGHGNFVVSPLSIHVALALLAAGAKGRTLDEIVSLLVGPEGAVTDLNSLTKKMIQVVLAEGSADGGPVLSCANAILVEESVTLKPSYEEVVLGMYKSKVEAVDFQRKADSVANEINSWVENATTGLIKELLSPESVGSDTRLLLVNALYFKGAWVEEFDPSITQNSEFHLLNGTTIQVPCMTTTKRQFLSSYEGFKVLRLHYEPSYGARRMFSMYIFLPDTRDGIWSLQEKISSAPEFLSSHLPMQTVKVRMLRLPKFKISFGFEASAVLRDLGMVSPFSPDADFSSMVEYLPDWPLFVSSVQHKSSIEVNERGTEAAAATVVSMINGWEPEVDFVADHPFIFFVREEMTGAILFAGHVKNPLDV